MYTPAAGWPPTSITCQTPSSGLSAAALTIRACVGSRNNAPSARMMTARFNIESPLVCDVRGSSIITAARNFHFHESSLHQLNHNNYLTPLEPARELRGYSFQKIE